MKINQVLKNKPNSLKEKTMKNLILENPVGDAVDFNEIYAEELFLNPMNETVEKRKPIMINLSEAVAKVPVLGKLTMMFEPKDIEKIIQKYYKDLVPGSVKFIAKKSEGFGYPGIQVANKKDGSFNNEIYCNIGAKRTDKKGNDFPISASVTMKMEFTEYDLRVTAFLNIDG